MRQNAACTRARRYTYPFPCIGADWLLITVRVLPFIVIIFMDTALFYQLSTTVFGILRGLFTLDLGVLTSWNEMVSEFYRAPARWGCCGEAAVGGGWVQKGAERDARGGGCGAGERGQRSAGVAA